MKNYWLKSLPLLVCLAACVAVSGAAHSETPDEWVALGKRVHGGFGSYIALGIRIGLDAVQELQAAPRELDVTYYNGPNAPCPCAADGLMLATTASPGQGSLRIAPTKSGGETFGVAIIKHKKTGQALRYTIPASARKSLDWWNAHEGERGRYDKVMAAPQEKLFRRTPESNAK